MSIMFFRLASLSRDQIGDQLARQQEQGHQQHQPEQGVEPVVIETHN